MPELEIKVLGGKCKNCDMLEVACRRVVEDFNLDAVITRISDEGKIADFNVSQTPALVVNDTLMSQRDLPSASDLEHWFFNAI